MISPDADVKHDGCIVHSTPRYYCEDCNERGWNLVKELRGMLKLCNDLILVSDQIIEEVLGPREKL